MVFITLVLSSNEWEKIRATAQTYSPREQLDCQMSRNECCRRLLLGGIDQLRSVSASERQNAVNAYALHLQPPADTNVSPWLPGAPAVDPW